jgi:predicted O-linked N-acetylglucosamine transferase (SPINDLY family)
MSGKHWPLSNLECMQPETTESLEQVIAKAEHLCHTGHAAVAVALYENWLEQTPFAGRSLDTDRCIAFFNLGVLQVEQGNLQAAQTAYEACVALHPEFMQARINLGWVLEKSGQTEAALLQWMTVVQSKNALGQDIGALQIAALNHMGRVYEQQKKYAQAEQALTDSLHLNPVQPDVVQHWLFLRMKQCIWPSQVRTQGLTLHATLRDASPLAMLALYDDPALQWAAASHLVQRKYAHLPVSKAKPVFENHERIRIGYLSGDLCTHAVGLLMPDFFAAHDTQKFEVFAFDYSPEDASACRQRIRQSVEHWVAVQGLSDAVVCQRIADHQIDVLIDLHGLSAGAKPEVMAQRPAKWQGAYLGFMGTTSMPWLDFVVTDPQLWPERGELFYGEQPLRVEPCAIPFNGHVEPSVVMTRQELGLPESAYVLGCFNHVYKINEAMWQAWMHVLAQTDNTVLWLLDDNTAATANLKAQAKAAGISEDRLFFAARTGYDNYRARLALIDLYLDTFPYNAGSTARDVLEMGTPLLTLKGQTVVSRMGASLLETLGLSELVTHTHDAYQKKAIQLSRSRRKTNQFRQVLTRASEHTSALVKSLEHQITQLVQDIPSA